MSVNATAAAALFAGLRANGVTDVIFSPGSRSTPLVLAAEARMRTWPILDERVAGFMALGLARARRAPVALVCTSGSAAAHWLPAVIEAWQTHTPLILLTADRPPELMRCGAGQTIDQRRIFGAFATTSADLPVPDRAVDPRVFALAGADAAQAQRPVHLNLPFREPLWTPGEVATPVEAPRVFSAAGPSIDAHALDALADRLRGAERGVIYCGPRAAVQPALIDRLSAALGWPAFCEAASGARFGPGAPMTRITAYDALVARFEAPQCLLQFGQAPHGRAVNGWLGAAPTIAVDPHGDRHDPRQTLAVLVRAPAEQVVRGLLDRLEPRPSGWRDAWIVAETDARQRIASACAAGAWEGRLARATAAATDGNLCVASSMPFRDVDAFAPASATARRVFVSRGANGIDGTIATALGVAQTGPTTVLLGDLALLHDASGLLTLARHPVDLTIVVPDNAGGGIFARLPIAAHPTALERCFLTPQPVDLAALTQAAGVRYQRLDDPAEWRAQIAAAHARPGVDLVHVPIDRAESMARRAAVFA